MSVTPVKRARDLIAGAIGQLSLRMHDGNNAVVDWSLFNQPEAGIAPSITWTKVIENLLFSEVAWLDVTHVGWHNRPAEVMRLDPETVTFQKKIVTRPYGTAEVWPDTPGVIRIDSPNDGILTAGATAIKAVIALQRAALVYSTGAPQQDWFESTDGVEPFETQADLDEFLDDWQEGRRLRATGHVPNGLAYKVNNLKALDMQLAEAREFATLEEARLTGIDADDLSVSQTSRTYQNVQDKYRQRAQDILGPFMTAIEGRLGMDDVTPHGYQPRFDLSDYMRPSDYTAAQTDQILVQSGIATRNEIRAKRGWEPIEGGDELPPHAPTAPALPAKEASNA